MATTVAFLRTRADGRRHGRAAARPPAITVAVWNRRKRARGAARRERRAAGGVAAGRRRRRRRRHLDGGRRSGVAGGLAGTRRRARRRGAGHDAHRIQHAVAGLVRGACRARRQRKAVSSSTRRSPAARRRRPAASCGFLSAGRRIRSSARVRSSRRWGSEILHLGPTGSGARMKLINNFVCGVQAAALAEAVALIERVRSRSRHGPLRARERRARQSARQCRRAADDDVGLHRQFRARPDAQGPDVRDRRGRARWRAAPHGRDRARALLDGDRAGLGRQGLLGDRGAATGRIGTSGIRFIKKRNKRPIPEALHHFACTCRRT